MGVIWAVTSSISTPVVGTVLYICLAKVTEADSIDVVFTIALGYALMFGMNLFLLGALIGDLRPSARDEVESESDLMEMVSEFEPGPDTNQPIATLPTTNKPAKTPPAAPQKPAKPNPAGSDTAKALAKNLSVKSVIRSANKPTATIGVGAKTYTVTVGETFSLETPKGGATVRCEEIRQNVVILSVNGERITLTVW